MSDGAAAAAAASDVQEQQPSRNRQQQQSVPHAHLRSMRLEEASFRLGDPSNSKLESEHGVVLSLSLADASRTTSESVDVALSAAELHKLLTTLRGMASTISGLTQQQGGDE